MTVVSRLHCPYADAYQMTGDEKYLEAAKRYSHQMMVTGMQTVNTTFLDNKHANTQVPKYIGFARIAQENEPGDATTASYRAAARNFWTEVVEHRTVALGGNSIAEHFLPANRSSEYITNPDGPESCNTNNMLKLTEDLFADNQDAKYADFYEYAMLNHILSTQNPHTGGYVYFTSMRPQHYRMYSQVNQGMWCCVGTGMENHSKYGEFIYAHSPENDTLFVNLFIASQLDSEHFALTQQTGFPYDEQTTLTINRAGTYVLAVRHPGWCTGDYKIRVNGTEAVAASTPGSYAYLSRTWAAGDKIEVSLPMELSLAACPNYDSYVAFRYGPVLLGAETGTENLAGQFAGEGRMDHCPSLGSQLSLTSAPMLIGQREDVLDSVEVVDKSRLHFKIKPGLYNSNRFAGLVLRPFFTIHECRYMMYWQQMTQTEWDAIKDEVMAEEEVTQRLQERTLDFIATGEQQSDAGHVLQGDFEKGSYSGEFYVDALAGKWFSYVFSTQGVSKDVSLMCRYHSADHGRVYTIYINDKELKQITLEPQNFTGFYNVEYLISEEFLKDGNGNTLDEITVKFAATGSTPTPGIYYLRLLKEYRYPQPYTFVCDQWVSGDNARVNDVEYDTEANTIKVYGKPGNNNIALQLSKYKNDSSYVNSGQKYLLVRGTSLKTGNGLSYLWWLNGANHNSQVAPTYETQDEEGTTTVIWDITQSGLTDYMQGDSIMLSDNGKACTTVFGLTSSSADGTAVITDISFYSLTQILGKYPELANTMRVSIFNETDKTYQAPRGNRTVFVQKAFHAEEWTPLCLPFNVMQTSYKDYFSEIKAFAGLHLDEAGVLTLYFEDAIYIKKGTPHIVKPITDITSLEFNSIRTFSTEEPEPLTTDGISVQGTFCQKEVDANTYIYKDGAFETNFTGEPAQGLGMYVQLSAEDMAKVSRVAISFDEMPTGIRAVLHEGHANGVYTINGIKIQDAQSLQDTKGLPKGIYIIGGKKITR